MNEYLSNLSGLTDDDRARIGSYPHGKSTISKSHMLRLRAGYEREAFFRLPPPEHMPLIEFRWLSVGDTNIYDSAANALAAASYFNEHLSHYPTLSEALEGKTDWNPQVVKGLAYTAVQPVCVDARELVVDVHREDQIARHTQHQQIVGF